MGAPNAHHKDRAPSELRLGGRRTGALAKINKNMLEYYVLHRRLRFERFRIVLREHLLGTLNESLARAGENVGFGGHLTVEGVGTVPLTGAYDTASPRSGKTRHDRTMVHVDQTKSPSDHLESLALRKKASRSRCASFVDGDYPFEAGIMTSTSSKRHQGSTGYHGYSPP
jgi:hypothetical protein